MLVSPPPLTTTGFYFGQLRYLIPVFQLITISPCFGAKISAVLMRLSLKSGLGLRDFYPPGVGGWGDRPIRPIYHQGKVVTQPQP